MKTTKEMIEVMKAYEDGRGIESRRMDCDDDWRQDVAPGWAWDCQDYRIKPEPEPEPRMMTERQLTELLAKGYGEFTLDDELETKIYPTYFYSKGYEDKPVNGKGRIRPWGGTEWVKPTLAVYEDFLHGKVADEPKTYKVGEWGQAGYIFYDKGIYSDGWRYLECVSADLKVIKSPAVPSGLQGTYCFPFGYYRASANGDNQLVGTDTAIGTGKANTEKLVDAMGTSAYTSSSGSGTTEDYAARLCSILEYGHDGVVYSGWFLPSKDELNLMYQNLKRNGLGSFADDYYWSSSESSAFHAWRQSFHDGGQNDGTRGNECRVRPARRF